MTNEMDERQAEINLAMAGPPDPDSPAALRAEINWLQENMGLLTDANAVHANMLRGSIAKPSREQVLHLYPEIAAEIERLRVRLQQSTEFINDLVRPRGDESSMHFWALGVEIVAGNRRALERADQQTAPEK